MKTNLYYYIVMLLITASLHACKEGSSDATEARSEFFVRGNCGMCKERIETAVMHVNGVKSADWNVDSKMLNVTYDSTKTNPNALNKAVAEVGHETKLAITPKEVHDKLPACCQKMKM